MWCEEEGSLGKRNREGIKVSRSETPSSANRDEKLQRRRHSCALNLIIRDAYRLYESDIQMVFYRRMGTEKITKC
jgi:hypothetical protein